MPPPQGWDPALILAQMLMMQCTLHLSLTFFFSAASFFGGPSPSLSQIFDPVEAVGSLGMAGFAVAAPVCGVALFFVVERARKCLDFACTVYLIHLCLCAVHSGFPSAWTWWLVMSLSAGTTSIIGEQLCMRKELEDIIL